MYQLHADRQGSVIAVTDRLGAVVSRYRYDAFGQRELVAGAEIMDVGFTGRVFDAESGLYHYRARTYDPAEGRFLQSDPLGFAAGDLNLYAYTWNDPANWLDPSGLSGVGAPARPPQRRGGSVAFSVITAGAIAIALSAAESPLQPAVLCLGNSTGTLLGSLGDNFAAGYTLIGQMAISMVSPCVVTATPGVWPMPMSDAGEAIVPPTGAPDPCKGVRKELRRHLKKFEDWQKNPYAMDNKGLLIHGIPVLDAFHIVFRSVSLRQQVMTWTNRVQKCERDNGLR